jgi:hypothetical protein
MQHLVAVAVLKVGEKKVPTKIEKYFKFKRLQYFDLAPPLIICGGLTTDL